MLRRASPNIEIKKRFDLIYGLVKQQNQLALNELLRKGVCLNPNCGDRTLIGLLAEDGDKKSVDFLIEKYKGNLNAAVFGYAVGGYQDLVNQLIAKGADIDRAVEGYAYRGC